jgi:hypothetical protein
MTTASATTSTSSASSTIIDMITEWQSRVVEMNRDLVDAVKPYVSGVPGLSLARSAFDTSLIDRTFQIGGDLLEANRKFTKDLLAVWAPDDEAPKASTAKK